DAGPAVGGGADAEILLAAGGGEPALDEGGDLRLIDVDAARLVQHLEGAEDVRAFTLERAAQRSAPLVPLQLRRVLAGHVGAVERVVPRDRKSTRLNSSHVSISY